MNSDRSRFAAVAIVAALALSVTAGCATAAPQPIATPAASATPDILTRSLPADVTARGVLLAAVLLKVGKVENAVSEGKVTPAEVDEAVKAIADGTVDLWRQRAATER